MPRLFLGNFDFEHRLADPVRQLPAKLNRINAELAMSWLAIADDGDYLWTPQPIEASFFEQAARDGLPRVMPATSPDAVPPGVECVPWGWTNDIRQLCDHHGWTRNAPPHEAVRLGNSRRFSAGLEREWLVGLDGAADVPQSFPAADALLKGLGPGTRWVLKAEFGMSGRERLLGEGPLTEAARNWLCKRFPLGRVFLEPWVSRLDEIGIQIEIPRAGEPHLIGLASLLVDANGQYAGSRFGINATLDEWDAAVDVALRAAVRLQHAGYFGPLGIDAMRYRDANGQQRVRPLQDINARWTMGRLSLGWRRLCQSAESGCWLHGPVPLPQTDNRSTTVDAGCEFLPLDPQRGRRIQTSPETVGGHPASHQSFLWIDY